MLCVNVHVSSRKDTYRLCLHGFAVGNAINIFLINDVLLHPSASHLLLIRMIIFMTRSADRNPRCNTHRDTQQPSSCSVKDRFICSDADKLSL